MPTFMHIWSRRCTLAAAVCVLWVAAQSAHAQDAEPERMVKTMVDAVIEALRSKRDDLRGARATEAGLDITMRLIAPHVDFEELARLATGAAWAAATPAQRATIHAQFRTLLLHVTGKLLAGYNDELLAVEPLTLATDAGAAEVRIKVTATRNTSDDPPQPMFISLAKTGAGWKIVDVRAEGISLAKLYAGNFAAVLARGEGLDNLIRLLEERNKLNAQQLAGKF